MSKTSPSPEAHTAKTGPDGHPAEKLHDFWPLAITVTDNDGAIIHVNAKAREIGLVRPCPGRNREELATCGLVRDDGLPLAPSEHPAERVRREGQAVRDERIGLCRGDEPTQWLQVTATSMPDLGVVATYLDATSSHQTEDDLQRYINELDAFFNANLDLLAVLDSMGHAVRLNPAWSTCLGYERGSVDYTRVLDLIHPADMEVTVGALARLRTRDEVVSFVNRLRHHDGGYRIFEWRATARDDLIYGTARDITQQRQAEEALLRSEQRFRAIFEQAAVGVAEVEPRSGRFVQVNQRLCDILGYTQSELEDRTFRSLSYPEGLEADLAAMRQLAAGEISDYRREKRYIHKDGHTLWAEVQVRVIHDPAVPRKHVVAVVQDTTQRKQADDQLRKALADALAANQRLNFQSSRMPLAFIAWDREFRVTQWNQAAERIFGWPASEAVGRHANDLIVPPDLHPVIDPLWSDLLDGTGSGQHNINENHTRDGRRITCEWFNASLVDADGAIVGVLSMAHDITERLRMEKELLQAERIQSLASFAGGVAHDANSVLYTIATLAKAIANGPADRETLGESVEAILRACAKGRTLVRGLIEFGRQDLANAKALNLNDVIEEQLHMLGSELPTNIRVDRDLEPGLGAMTGDARVLDGAFMHLLLNALEAMPNGGTLTLRTRAQGKNDIAVDIEDTGVGMSKEVLERAMEPFFTTKPRNQQNGLGLPAAYGAVKAHQGRIELHSEPGKGTRVHIVLPRSPGAAPRASESFEGAAIAKSLRILVVDDDDLVQAAMSAQLRRLGHTVTLAQHGQAALDKVREGLEVDLVLLDINMPVLDGTQTLPRLRELRPSLPVIIETGSMGDSAQELARAYQDVAVLLRPFNMSELKAALEPWIRRTYASPASV
jgi:PAS domain S-box-containing protein